jgi:hypothetical protein
VQIDLPVPLDFEQARTGEAGGHGGSNRRRRRHPRARLSWGNKRGGHGEPAAVLTRVGGRGKAPESGGQLALAVRCRAALRLPARGSATAATQSR